MVLETLRPLQGLIIGMESVRGGMRADETLPSPHEIEEGLLARQGHRGLLVGARGAEVPGGVEHHRVELRQILWRKLRTILGEDELHAVRGAELEELFLREARLALTIGNDVMFVARGLREEQDLAKGGVGGGQRGGGEQAEHCYLQ